MQKWTVSFIRKLLIFQIKEEEKKKNVRIVNYFIFQSVPSLACDDTNPRSPYKWLLKE